MSNLRRSMAGRGGGIPYQEIEYLEGDSNAYIETAIFVTFAQGRNVHWFAKVGIKEASNTRRFLFSAYNLANRNFYCEIDANNRYAAGNAYTTAISAGNMYDCEMELNVGTSNNVKINVGGSEYSATQSAYITAGGVNIQICLFRLAGSYKGSGHRIGRNLIYVDSSLVRDFVPVRVGTTGYMYDRVSGQLFGNAGTGDFILGNDIN